MKKSFITSGLGLLYPVINVLTQFIQLLGHCVVTWYAKSLSLVKLTQIFSHIGRNSGNP